MFAGSLVAQGVPRPDVIPLPDGFQPEGIASGPGNSVFVGSLADGDIVRADLRTGEVAEVVETDGRIAVGLKFRQRTKQLIVAGGPSGLAYVYDARSGADQGAVELTSQPSFINDVTLTRDGAWFTNSFAAELYFLPIGRDGSLGTPRTIRLSGPAADTSGAFNVNGIAASPDGSRLIVAHSARAEVIAVDPDTGASQTIDLGLGSVPTADGILLDGPRLWVVQNFLNQVAEIRLNPDYLSGTLVSTRTDEDFRIPTTIARHGNALAAVNARFDLGMPPPADASYEIVVIPR